MTRLPVALACLALAALFAVVGYVLARPRWRWESERELCHHPDCHGSWWTYTSTEPGLPPDRGSPPSLTVCGFNDATAWSAAVNTPDDAARWAGG